MPHIYFIVEEAKKGRTIRHKYRNPKKAMNRFLNLYKRLPKRYRNVSDGGPYYLDYGGFIFEGVHGYNSIYKYVDYVNVMEGKFY